MNSSVPLVSPPLISAAQRDPGGDDDEREELGRLRAGLGLGCHAGRPHA